MSEMMLFLYVTPEHSESRYICRDICSHKYPVIPIEIGDEDTYDTVMYNQKGIKISEFPCFVKRHANMVYTVHPVEDWSILKQSFGPNTCSKKKRALEQNLFHSSETSVSFRKDDDSQ